MDKRTLRVKVEIMDEKNIRQVKAWFQKLAPSSKENRTPPKWWKHVTIIFQYQKDVPFLETPENIRKPEALCFQVI